MSVLEDLGISADEWRVLEPTEQQRLIRGQAKLEANRQLISQAVIEDDDRDIRRRVKNVERDILGNDANVCVDNPLDEQEDRDMRVTILGDVNSEKALKFLRPGATAILSPLTMGLLALLAIALLGGLILLGIWLLNTNPSDPVSGTGYDITALPYQPSETNR